MSRQLNKIRNLISDIESIQKNGQQARGGHALVSPAALSAQLEVIQVAETIAPAVVPTEAPVAPALKEEEISAPLSVVPPPISMVLPPLESAPAIPEPGRVEMQLTGNIVVVLEIDGSNEVLEIRRLKSPQNCIEIRFADGKAVHLPLKDVA